MVHISNTCTLASNVEKKEQQDGSARHNKRACNSDRVTAGSVAQGSGKWFTLSLVHAIYIDDIYIHNGIIESRSASIADLPA